MRSDRETCSMGFQWRLRTRLKQYKEFSDGDWESRLSGRNVEIVESVVRWICMTFCKHSHLELIELMKLISWSLCGHQTFVRTLASRLSSSFYFCAPLNFAIWHMQKHIRAKESWIPIPRRGKYKRKKFVGSTSNQAWSVICGVPGPTVSR